MISAFSHLDELVLRDSVKTRLLLAWLVSESLKVRQLGVEITLKLIAVGRILVDNFFSSGSRLSPLVIYGHCRLYLLRDRHRGLTRLIVFDLKGWHILIKHVCQGSNEFSDAQKLNFV